MNTLVYFVALASAMLLTHTACAQDAEGHWAVSGSVDGKNFTLDCRFQKTAENLSGACIDGPTGDTSVPGGRSHPLIAGHVSGDKMDWTYQSSYLFIKFDVEYAGVISGDRLSGTIAAAGKKGTFTADRLNP